MSLFRIPLQVLLTLSALFVAAVAHYLHVFREQDMSALVSYAAALGLWFAALVFSPVRIETRDEETAPPVRNARRLPTTLALSALGLALLTFVFISGNQFNSDNALAWLGSIGAFLYAFWIPERDLMAWRAQLGAWISTMRNQAANGIRLPLRAVILFAILLVAAFFSFYDLAGVPAEMESDHAENVLDIADVLDGARPIYFERNTGREPLEFYATAAFVALSQRPLDFMALKLVSASSGLLLVAAVFFLTRELFETDVALAAAALVAVAKWPVSLDRLGLSYQLPPLAIAATLYFFVRALKFQRRNDFLIAGLLLGLGLYGADAFRIAPVLILAIALLWYAISSFDRRPPITAFALNVALLFALALIVAVPLVRFAVDQPAVYWYHVLARIGAGDASLPGNPVALFSQNVAKAALMFNWHGDGAWFVNVPGDPALDLVTASLFLFGLVFALYRLLRSREKVYLILIAGLFIALLPSILSLANPDENPSAVEASTAVPFVCMIAALSLVWIGRSIVAALEPAPWRALAGLGAVALVFAAAAAANYSRYFVDFNVVYRQASRNSTEIAEAIRGFDRSIGDAEHAWLIAYPYWVDPRSVGIDMGHVGWQQALPNAQAAVSVPADSANKLYVLAAQDRTNLATLEQLFPNGQPRVFHASTPGHDFVLFYVPGTGVQGELYSAP
ncbi:MAG: glycosyltransferase family 39 protein [Chloroflexi bacterium]|nr:glycosyltransferase family 39 protein [Chloroflexota bacterium]